MHKSIRPGLYLLITLTTLLLSRIPLAQGGSVPHLYLADGAWDSEDCRLIRMDDLTGKGWTTFGSKGKADKQFGSVTGVAVDSKGRIYGVDQENSRILRIDDMSGKGLLAFGKPGKARGQFNYPCGICIDAQDHIYITDTSAEMGPKANRVIRMDDMTGKNWTTFGTEGKGTNRFRMPGDIAFDRQGRIYICEHINHRIVGIDDITGKNRTTFAPPARSRHQFFSLSGLCIH